ncbi:APC family permease [Metamycoplasma buccale]|uniref:APC family permease n=1 Tax=Metamycoplasma buccale TaxID=55602 RepID=UPI00398F226D
MNDEQLVVTQDNKKKISFFSAILIVIGGSIGAGIFLRSKSVLSNSANNIVWAIIVWLIAGFAVITMALALVEVASGRNDNLGMIGWAKAFNTLYIYKGAKFFMTYLYLPFTYFFMPYYVIVQFQDGLGGFGLNIGFGGSKLAPWFYFLIGLGLTLWMIFSAGLSSRIGNVQNWVVTSVKFIPLIAVVIVGFAFAAKNGITYNKITTESLFDAKSTSLFGLSPFFAVFASLGGIFFAFDGFYVTAGVQSEMKHPEKTPAALTIGLSTITIIYIIIAVAMTLGAKTGGFYDYGELLANAKHGWAFGVINICISIGIVGILNGFTMWATRWVEDLIKEGEISVPVKVYKYMKSAKTPLVGAIFCLILALPFMVIFTAIGAYAYFGGGYDSVYGYKIDNLLTFSDLMADWMAVFAFGFIAASIAGAIKNRKKHFIAVTENKHTIWAGSFSVTIVATVLTFLIINPFFSAALETGILLQGKEKFISDIALDPGQFDLIAKQDEAWQGLVNSTIGHYAAAVLFIVYTVVMFVPTVIEKKSVERKALKIEEKLKTNLSVEERENVLLAKELNDIVLKTYQEARV